MSRCPPICVCGDVIREDVCPSCGRTLDEAMKLLQERASRREMLRPKGIFQRLREIIGI